MPPILRDSVVAPTSGNIVSGGLGGSVGFGADGGYLDTFTMDGTTFKYDPKALAGAGEVTRLVGTGAFTFDTSTNSLIVNTLNGGKMVINMDTGDYTYTPAPTISAAKVEYFSYTVVDKDGDGATATLTINVNPPPAIAAVESHVTSISSPSALEGATMTYTVNLDVMTGQSTTFSYAMGGGSAVAADYNTLTFSNGVTLSNGVLTVPVNVISFTVSVNAIADGSPEVAETLPLTIDTVTGIGTIAVGTQPTISVNDVTVNEAAGTATFTVSLSAASNQAISVNYVTANGTATSGSDYTAKASTTLNFAAGVTNQTVTVNITNDTLFEGISNETFFVNLTTPVNATIADSQGIGYIKDNDAAPTVTTITSPTVAEGSNLVYTVTLSNASTTATTIPFTLGGGTAVAADYGTATYSNSVTASGGNLIIPANVTTFTVTLPTTTVGTGETGETVPLTIGGVTGTGTISGDVNPTISINDVTVNEAAGTATFTVSLSSASSQAISVKYVTANDTATSGTDYTAKASTTLNFAAGVTTQTVTVNITNDAVYEGATGETFFVNLSGAVNATIADNKGIGTIIDNEAAPTVTTITSPTVAEGTNLVYTVTLSNASSTATTIPFTLGGGTAVTADYGTATYSNSVTASAGNLVIPANVTSFTVTLPTTTVGTGESGETVPLTIGGVTGTGTISGDINPTISVNDVTVNETAGTATFTVSLSSASSQLITVNYSTTNGTATAGSDYTSKASTTLSFAAGVTSQTVTVAITNDTIYEGSTGETFNVVLAGAVNATILDGTGVATIIDNDVVPTVTAITSPTVAEGTSLVYAVTLSSASSTVTTIPFTLGGGSAAVADYGTLTFNNGVSIVGSDLIIPANVTSFNVTLPTISDGSNESGETVPLTIGGITGTGTISGTTIPTISVNDVTVNESAGTATFTVSLSSASTQAISVSYSTTNGTAVAGSDYTAKTSTVLNFAAGETTKTVTVAIANDTVFEGATGETFNVVLATPVNATILDGTGVGTITDNDSAPTVTSVSSPTVAEGTSLLYTVTLSNPSSTATTVAFTLGGGTAIAADYGSATYSGGVTPSGTNLIIPAGVSSFTVSLPTISDADTVGETVPLTVGGVTGTGTIAGADPTISINDISVNEAAGTATFTVSLSTATTKVGDVNYSTGGGTATSGVDYGALASTKLTFAAGETSKTITVNIANDTAIEADETFNVTLATAVNATIADATGVATIVDNDSAPVAPLAAPMMMAAVAVATPFTDANESVKVNEDTTLKGTVLTGTTSSSGTVTISSYLIDGNTYVFKAGEVATLSGVGTLVIAADGNYTFVPAANYNGSVPLVTYTMTDGSTTDSSTLAISVTAVNDTPVAVNDSVITQVDAPLTVASTTLLINDGEVDGDPLTLFSVQAANHGSVVMVGSDVVFTPTAGYTGAASFDYTVSDGHGSTSTTTVDVNVNGAPVAVADAVTGTANTPLTIASTTLLSNDTDPNGDPLTISSVLDATHGTVALVDGSVVFTPTKDYVGEASFSYTISDGHGGSASASVSLTIAADLLKAGTSTGG